MKSSQEILDEIDKRLERNGMDKVTKKLDELEKDCKRDVLFPKEIIALIKIARAAFEHADINSLKGCYEARPAIKALEETKSL